MVLLDALVNDIGFEVVRFIILGACMVCGVLAGKKLRERTNAKKSTKE